MVEAICRIVVGVLLLISGATKLREPRWPAMAREFGTPRPLIPLIPWVEIALGALLTAQIGGRWVAMAALVLLGTFTVAIAVHLARGRRIPCGCFGAASTEPVSTLTLTRN